MWAGFSRRIKKFMEGKRKPRSKLWAFSSLKSYEPSNWVVIEVKFKFSTLSTVGGRMRRVFRRGGEVKVFHLQPYKRIGTVIPFPKVMAPKNRATFTSKQYSLILIPIPAREKEGLEGDVPEKSQRSLTIKSRSQSNKRRGSYFDIIMVICDSQALSPKRGYFCFISKHCREERRTFLTPPTRIVTIIVLPISSFMMQK